MRVRLGQERRSVLAALAAAGAWLWFSGCVIDTTPLPDPITGENNGFGEEDTDGSPTADGDGFAGEEGRYYSPTFLYYAVEEQEDTTYVVGVPGVVEPGAVQVFVTNGSRPDFETVAVTLAGDGSFVVPVAARFNELLEVVFLWLDDGAVVPDTVTMELVLQPVSTETYLTNQNLSATFVADELGTGSPDSVVVEDPNPDGLITLIAGADAVMLGMNVVVSNLSLGVAVDVLPNSDGSFEVTLAGTTGDELILFSVERAVNQGGAPPVHLFVP